MSDLQPVGVRLVADEADNYLRILHGVADATAAFVSALKPAAAAVNDLDSESSSAAKAVDKLQNSTIDAARGVMDFGDSAEKSGKGLDELGDDATATGKDVDKLGDEAEKSGKKTKGLGDDAEKGGKGLDALGQAATGALRKLGELAVDGIMEAGQAIAAFAVDGVNKAGDFEAKMLEFGSVTGESLAESGKSVEDFSDLFMQMGRDLPVSTADVQQAAIELAKGGIDPATIAAGGLKTALDLAAAGGISIAEAAEIGAKQLGVWVDAAANATTKARFLTDTSDLLAQAANASSVNVDDLALGLANAGGVAKVAGLTFKETVTTMALLAPGFSSAADAGTSLKTMLSRLQPTTSTAADAMASLNLLTNEGKSKFYDLNGQFIGMEKAAALLQGSLKGLSQAQRESTLQAIFGQDAVRAAAILAEKGADGYNRMGKSMGSAGSAAAQAAKRQQGFNTAVDNLMGSLEAFQLAIATKALPVLTDLMKGLSDGINAIISYAKATAKGETVVAQIAGVISDAFIPAVGAASAAVMLYALRSIPAAVAALPGFIASVGASTAALGAQAAAAALALGPFVVLAAAVGGAILVWNKFDGAVKSSTKSLLDSRSWWTDSTKALDAYSQSADYVQQIVGTQATKLQELRTQQELELDALTRRMALNPSGDYSKEMNAINERAGAIRESTAELNHQIEAYDEQHLRSYDAIEDARAMRGAQGELKLSLGLTAEELGKLREGLIKIRDDGVKAMGDLATTHASFVRDMEGRQRAHEEAMVTLTKEKADARTEDARKAVDDRIKAEQEGYRQQLIDAAKAYAEQAALQRAALGEQLLNYVTNQEQQGKIGAEKADELRDSVVKSFGVQRDSAAAMFGDMTDIIDKYAKGAISDSKDVEKSFGETEDAAVELRDKAEKLKDKYVMEIIAEMEKPGANIDALRKKLADVPRRVEVEISVQTTYTSRGQQPQGGAIDFGAGDEAPSGRAAGGPVAGGRTYPVGEHGRELFTPATDGYIWSNPHSREAIYSPNMLSGRGGGGGQTTIINLELNGAGVTEAQVYGAVRSALAAEGRGADAYLRTGGTI